MKDKTVVFIDTDTIEEEELLQEDADEPYDNKGFSE